MNDSKRYYWIKLRTDFFDSNEIDYLLSQENGFEFVLLYQMLCLQTANQEGMLGTKIGENVIQYDIKKIVRDTKFFNEDIVLKAFKLYKDLKLIFLDNDKCFRITNYENIVGSETYRSKTKKRTKKKIRVILP